MRRSLLCLVISVFSLHAPAQETGYKDSLQSFRDKYIKDHEVVKGNDKSFLRFFPIDEKYRVAAEFERIYEAGWFKMETSGKEKRAFRVYGLLHFKLNGTTLTLHVYQSKELISNPQFANYLFLPFTDKTSGEESYDNGRYIDLTIAELEQGNYFVDFNKAYNPYCAYISNQYNCPVPPKENDLDLAIRAGEKKFGKGH